MSNENVETLNELEEIMFKHGNVMNDYDEILMNYDYKKMSLGDGIYGKYFPEPYLEKYFEYNGKLTKNEKKKDFVYYFDKNDKLVLTERYSNGTILNAILFYYIEDIIEIVWYCMKKHKIITIGKITHQDNNLEKFIDTGNVKNGRIDSFKEYLFNTGDEYIKIKSYIRCSNNREMIINSSIKK